MRDPADHGLRPTMNSANEARPERSRPPRIILLEDNETNAAVFQIYLEMSGYPKALWVTSVKDAQLYLEPIVDGAFDLVFFDLMLPDGESLDLIKQIIAAGGSAPCVYTARSSRIDIERLRAAGVQHVFKKPLPLEGFKERLDALMDGAR